MTGIVKSAHLCSHSSSAMSRPIVLHICLAFCSFLVLNFSTQCLAFPTMERREIRHIRAENRQLERTEIEGLGSKSGSSAQTPQPVLSEDPTVGPGRPSATSLSQVSPANEGTHPVGAELTQPNDPTDYTPTKSGVPTEEEELLSSSQPERTPPEGRLPKPVLAVSAPAALNLDEKEEPVGSTDILPLVQVTTEATQGLLKSSEGQMFPSESQEEVSLGPSPSSDANRNAILTTSLRTESIDGPTEHRVAFLAGPEPPSLAPDREWPSQTRPADDTQATATKYFLASSQHPQSIEPQTDSLPGAPKATASGSAAVATASALGDEWDDTKLARVSHLRAPHLGDDTEAQVRMETSQAAQVTRGGVDGTEPSTGAADRAQGLPNGESYTGSDLPVVRGAERSAAVTDRGSFTPTSPVEDGHVSLGSLLLNAAEGFTETTAAQDAAFSLENTVPVSGYEAEASHPLGNTFKDIITQEMAAAGQEAEATLPLVTQEQVSTLEVTRENGEPEEEELPSPMSGGPGVTQLSRRSEPLDAVVSTTALTLSFEVTPSGQEIVDSVTGPREELFTSVSDPPGTLPGGMEQMVSASPALPASERRTIRPSISRVSTAATYGLDQLESEEGEEDEEEEEEDEEDEDEEEEEEEDKDADALDESFDSDTELPGFTPPGVTSQEPGLELGNMGPLEGATYQVPDAIKWEQQNQGLVRNWMEKLKDKASYMSGMLVPVGVGIAGALFILGALYSIKVMNRRRRNGFKRHKRKQREFNSMQDRVMLLADSSEDEF
ncbi:armadillo-like helical domain-containing protein 4 [Tenrec ecaudatus]|uniref:armadillo-like helical domain-containing protein 4 n=1 Tax=Tenrec ecaudatus TaxID=94439 RepID=UPI003F5AB1D5